MKIGMGYFATKCPNPLEISKWQPFFKMTNTLDEKVDMYMLK